MTNAEQTTTDAAAGDHGSRPVQRVSPGEYGPEFLRRLRSQKVVHVVPADWNHDEASLPSSAMWVIYPNGDLERLGF